MGSRGGITLGLCLIASLDPSQIGHWLLVILQVALGLGAVIFVHELGHFAVAKMCGVKCDKFFIGFDIGGYKISRKWGETEYGIGILPLGGYVKMMGQDDNPANISEQVKESQVSGGDVESKEITGPDGEKYLVDKRSYLAKSVPQRMAIISAGVIMNVIFAVIFAVIAFGIGVPYYPCVVSETSIGSAAWEAGLRPGDEIVQVGDIPNPSFSNLMGGVMLGDLENGIDFRIKRAGAEQSEPLTLKPKPTEGRAKIGVSPPHSNRLSKVKPTWDGSPAGQASEEFQGEDEIIAIDGAPISDYRGFIAQMVSKIDQPVEVTVRRGGKAPKGDPFGPREGGEEVTIEVQPRTMKRFGLVMQRGEVAALEEGSPAAEAGIKVGDVIDDFTVSEVSTADQQASTDTNFTDPLTLPYQLKKLADKGHSVSLSLSRDGEDGKTIDVPLRNVDWSDSSFPVPDEPLSLPELGIGLWVLNRVSEVMPGSPAAEAELQSGDVISKAEYIYPESEKDDPPKPLEFDDEKQRNWAFFILSMQDLPAGTKMKLTIERGDETLTKTLEAQEAEGQYLADRGFNLDVSQRLRIASNFGEQMQLGWDETVNSLTLVFRFLQKLTTGQVPATSLGGPVTIAKAAGMSAFDGIGKLLVFLTMLSANLAVINFLPIPLLDGGHMVFLAYEGLRGRPANERFVVALHTVGFVCIVSLMLFVLSLDFGLIDRNL